jgi:hypothetical protein
VRVPKPRALAARAEDGTPRSEADGWQPRIKFRASKIDRSAASSPAPAGNVANASGGHGRRARPETSHQKAVILNRKMRIESILYKKLVKVQGDRRRAKRKEKINQIYRAMSRILTLPDEYDSEGEGTQGVGGLIPDAARELEDFGSEALTHRKVLDRGARRLARDETRRYPTSGLGDELEHLLREDKIDIISPNDPPRRRKPGTRPRRADRAARRRRAAEDLDGAENRGPDDDSGDDSAGDAEDSDETIEDPEETGEWATTEV